MVEYRLAHIGINCENSAEAMKAAGLFELMFGFAVNPGKNSVYAGTAAECMRNPGPGRNGHIGIGTPDVAAAKADLESRGFTFNMASAKYAEDGTLRVIYMTDEVCGFAVHLVRMES